MKIPRTRLSIERGYRCAFVWLVVPGGGSKVAQVSWDNTFVRWGLLRLALRSTHKDD